MLKFLFSKSQIDGLKGEIIHKVFKDAEEIAELYGIISSPRGNYFRRRLLQALGNGLTYEEIEEMRHEFDLREVARHLDKLGKYNLIRQVNVKGKEGFIRTEKGGDAVNAVREFERKVGQERARKVFEANLGQNSIKLFLKIFGQERPADPKAKEIIYTPLEIGEMASFLPRTVEGIASTDKLDSAGLVTYLDDGNVHVNPRRSVAFYQYLRNLYQLLKGK